MPGLHPGGRGFKSRPVHHNYLRGLPILEWAQKNKDFLGNVTICFVWKKGGNPVSGGTRGGKRGRERGVGKPKPLKKKERKEKKKRKKLARLEKRTLR